MALQSFLGLLLIQQLFMLDSPHLRQLYVHEPDPGEEVL
jgi:hypothetical protein